MAPTVSDDDDTYTNDNIAQLTRKYRASRVKKAPNATKESDAYEEIVAKNRSRECSLTRTGSFENLTRENSFTSPPVVVPKVTTIPKKNGKRATRKSTRANLSCDNSVISGGGPLSRENSFTSLSSRENSFSGLARGNSYSNISGSFSLSRENSYTNLLSSLSRENSHTNLDATGTSRRKKTSKTRKESQLSPTSRENRPSRRTSRVSVSAGDVTSSSDESVGEVRNFSFFIGGSSFQGFERVPV